MSSSRDTLRMKEMKGKEEENIYMPALIELSDSGNS